MVFMTLQLWNNHLEVSDDVLLHVLVAHALHQLRDARRCLLLLLSALLQQTRGHILFVFQLNLCSTCIACQLCSVFSCSPQG